VQRIGTARRGGAVPRAGHAKNSEARQGAELVLEHYSLDAAIAWVDAIAGALAGEGVSLPIARTRVLAETIRAPGPIPANNRAALDGFAVQASASIGASSYNPIRVPLIAVAAGDALPAGTDAVVPLQLAEPDDQASIEIVEVVAAGDNVEQQGAAATVGATLVAAGTRLEARHIGLLTAAGLPRISVVRRPRVRIFIAKPTKAGASEDSNGPMIRVAVERDGGVGEFFTVERDQMTIQAALVDTDADIAIVIGGTGPGSDDHSAEALAAAGELAIHGVALRPGETSGLGRTVRGVPVVLLPGAPASCLWAYELFAGRAIRRLGGRAAELPYRSHETMTARKIVSSLGLTEICPIRFGAGGGIEPLPSFAEIGLMAAVSADGFVIVPQGSEGYPQGARLTVYLYDEC
jgi:molybdopterin molybdotransferase